MKNAVIEKTITPGGDTQSEWMERCMSHFKTSIPEHEQRIAACLDMWREKSAAEETEEKIDKKKKKCPKTGKAIKFNFHPYDFDNKGHVISKADETGEKRRYLKGIASGTKWDAHDERMTKDCIKSFHNQATSGQILLYADVHGIKATEAIGVLEKSEVSNTGDWIIKVRLWDEIDKEDGLPQPVIDKAQTAWMMANGQPPFKKSAQFGFSIEGIIPEDGVLKEGPLGRRVLNKIDLDGVVLVPRPAYKDSVAHAIYKALGEPTYWKSKLTLSKALQEQLNENEEKQNYFNERWDLDNALDTLVDKIMCDPNVDKREQLEIVLDEYKVLLIQTLIKHQDAFEQKPETPDPESEDINGITMIAEAPEERVADVLKGKRTVKTGMSKKRKQLWKQVTDSINRLAEIQRGRNQ